MKNKSLTPIQKNLLDAFNDKSNWRPPSARMLARITGRHLPNVYKTLQELNKKGYMISLYPTK